jgi:hypothetical protein
MVFFYNVKIGMFRKTKIFITPVPLGSEIKKKIFYLCFLNDKKCVTAATVAAVLTLILLMWRIG